MLKRTLLESPAVVRVRRRSRDVNSDPGTPLDMGVSSLRRVERVDHRNKRASGDVLRCRVAGEDRARGCRSDRTAFFSTRRNVFIVVVCFRTIKSRFSSVFSPGFLTTGTPRGKMTSIRSILLKDLNSILTCPLCSGYYIDATTLVDCMHSFCKSCILKHFENNKLICPTCSTACKRKENFSYYRSDMQLQTLVYKIVPGLYAKDFSYYRSDMQLQTLVYKIVPGLYAKEIQRREDFYRTAGVRASSSCSDDSVIGDNMQEHEEWIHTLGDENQFLSPDDSISLSLEYYQQNLDTTSSSPKKTEDRSTKSDSISVGDSVKRDRNVDDKLEVSDDKVQSDKNDSKPNKDEQRLRDRRYLQCPAAVSMTHLQKFIRMKYALSSEHKKFGENAIKRIWPRWQTNRRGAERLDLSDRNLAKMLPRITYTKQDKPKSEVVEKKAQSIKSLEVVEKKAQSIKSLQQQISKLHQQSLPKPNKEMAREMEKTQNSRYGETHDLINLPVGEKRKRDVDDKEKDDQVNEKRRKTEQVDQTTDDTNCIFDYEEPDKEELKRFAEKRNREWQMIKHSDDEHRAYKKRKKNKHSKGEKRKLHAEITSELSNKQESIKLKVKLTPHNGHRHSKHNKAQNTTGKVRRR
ncbi:Zinc finger, C3HC4 type (RING finger) [Popillia japonica]|uniref:Zinc finger, C3HC4 type (RING finger) n=1 Tax=Popillia japonica TaxID=7064 RepID=A0AAW1JF97_POPJA